MNQETMMREAVAKRKEFVKRWLPELVAKLGRTEEALLTEGLWCTDFPFEGVRIEFEDGSLVQFPYAFAIEKPIAGGIMRPVAVFTEHCGYHEFLVSHEEIISTATATSDPASADAGS